MNLATRLININSKLEDISNNKVALAFDLLNTKRHTYWKDTPYDSWRAFCDTNIALSQASIYVYIKTADLAEKNKFTDSSSSLIVQTIGWERFRIGLTKIGSDEIITGAEFIKRYKYLNLNERVTYNESESSLVNFNFSVPKDIAEILTNELVSRGMRITNKSRTNMSSAMGKLVNDIAKKS